MKVSETVRVCITYILEMHYPSGMHRFLKKRIGTAFTAIGESQVEERKRFCV